MTSPNDTEANSTTDDAQNEPPIYEEFRERAREATTEGSAAVASYPIDWSTRRAIKDAENRLRSIKLPAAALNDIGRTLRTLPAVQAAAAEQISRIVPLVTAPPFSERLTQRIPPLFTVPSPSFSERLVEGLPSFITTQRSFSEQLSEGIIQPLITAQSFSEDLATRIPSLITAQRSFGVQLSEGISSLITTQRSFSEQLSEGIIQPLITAQSFSERLVEGFPSLIATQRSFGVQLFSWQKAWDAPMQALLNSVQSSLAPLRNLISGRLTELASLSGIGNIVGRIGLSIALRARDAAIRLNDDDKEFLAWFMHVWLGIKKVTVLALDATAAALLDPSWDTGDPRDVLHDIRGLITDYKRAYRPLGDTKIKRQKICGLDREIFDESGVATKLVDLTPSRTPSPEMLYLESVYTDPRLLLVLEKLDPVERAILDAKSMGGTWTDAAIMCGQDHKRGEAVRRKVRGISNRMAS